MAARLVVVGGDGAATVAASEARRHRPDLEVVVLQPGRWASWSAAGIPALLGGAIADPADLVVESTEALRAARIDVRTEHRVESLDLGARTAEIADLAHGRSYTLGFDLLHLATGTCAGRPAVPGVEGPQVHAVEALGDAARLLDHLRRATPRHVVVVGAAAPGLRAAGALRERGLEVTVIDHGPGLLPGFEPGVGDAVAAALRAAGVAVRTGEDVVGIEDGAVHTTGGQVAADAVVLGTDAVPDAALAEAAGIGTGRTGAVPVDRRQRTSAPGVWAAGGCCEALHRVSGQPVHHADGAVAATQGRVAGIGLAGGYATSAGVLATSVLRTCGIEAARTGLAAAEAAAAGFEAVSATSAADGRGAGLGWRPDRAGPPVVALLAERGSGRLLGGQVLGATGAAGLIGTVAAALAGGLAAGALADADLGWAAPPLGADPLRAAARHLADAVAGGAGAPGPPAVGAAGR